MFEDYTNLVFDQKAGTDLSESQPTKGNIAGGLTTIEDIRNSRLLYMPDLARRGDPLVSPVRADLRGLPPVFLSVASHDPLYDENIAMASKLGDCDLSITRAFAASCARLTGAGRVIAASRAPSTPRGWG